MYRWPSRSFYPSISAATQNGAATTPSRSLSQIIEIIHHDPSLPLPSVLRKLLRRKRRAAPWTTPACNLSSIQFILQLVIHPLCTFSFKVVRRQPDRRTSGHGVMLHVQHRGSRGALQPESCCLPSDHFLCGSHVGVAKAGPILHKRRFHLQGFPHTILILLSDPRVRLNLVSTVAVD